MIMIVRGLPGSGKSSLARQMEGYVHIEDDMFWGEDYKFDRNWLRQAREWCLAEVTRHVYHGRNVVVSNTFTTLSEMKPYLDLGRYANVPVFIYNCYGEFGSIHNVPEDIIEAMKARWQQFPECSGKYIT